MGKYKSLANFYKFGFGRYPGFTRSTNLVRWDYRYASILCIRRGGTLVGIENTAAVHTAYPIESDGRRDGRRLESSQ